MTNTPTQPARAGTAPVSRRLKNGLVLSIASLVLAGCSTVQLEPLEKSAIATAIEKDERLFSVIAPPIEEPLNVNSAMARALKFNLDNRVKLMEEALAEQGFELAKMDMLPVLAANAGYVNRNNVDASSSRSVLTGFESLEPSTSVDQERNFADLKLSWNVLDFGVSYLKAKQEADRVLIAGNARRDIMAKLLQQTRASFWRTAVTQRLSPEVLALQVETEDALARLERIQQEKLRAPLDVLKEQRQLLSIMRNLKSLQRSADSAEIELASLINQPPGQRIPVSIPEDLPELPALPSQDINVLERVALANSGEYVGQLYNARIAQREARKSMLRLLPGLEFSYGVNYDSNSFLYNNSWSQAGARISWNIMRLFAYDELNAQNDAREQMVEARRLAANMATIARVNLGWQQYHNALDALHIAQRFEALDSAIADYSSQARASSAISGTRSLVDRAKALNTMLTNALAYADAQEAYGGFLSSLGFNPVPNDYQRYDLDALAQLMSNSFQAWSRGEMLLEDPQEWLTESDELSSTTASGADMGSES